MTALNPCTPQPTGRDQMEIDGFVDSFAPFDEEICTHSGWPMPAPRNFSALDSETKSAQGEPAQGETKAETKSWRENLRALVERVGL